MSLSTPYSTSLPGTLHHYCKAVQSFAPSTVVGTNADFRLAYERAVTALNLQQQPACVLRLVFPGGGGKSCPHCCVTAMFMLTIAMAVLDAPSSSATFEVSQAKGRAKSAGRHNWLSQQA